MIRNYNWNDLIEVLDDDAIEECKRDYRDITEVYKLPCTVHEYVKMQLDMHDSRWSCHLS
jgi:hypothetical protein